MSGYFHKDKKKKYIKKKEPKIIENPKQSIIFKGGKTSVVTRPLLLFFHQFRWPHSKKFSKHNKIIPFSPEMQKSVEFFSKKNDCSLFCYASHSKKRPHNIIMGRLFDYQLLDVFEFGISDFKEMVSNQSKYSPNIGSKPLILFQGSLWRNDQDLWFISNFFVDFFRGEEVKSINLLGLDHAIVFTALSNKKISFKHISTNYKNKKLEINEIGPSFNFEVRRIRKASEDLRKESLRVPKQLLRSKKYNKNIEFNELGDKKGRIHVDQQDISQIALKKFKALKKDKVFDKKIKQLNQNKNNNDNNKINPEDQ